MTEKKILTIMEREVNNITKTGKPPKPGALPKWFIYLDHQIDCSLQISLTVASQIHNRVRVFFTTYNLQTGKHTHYIDGVEY